MTTLSTAGQVLRCFSARRQELTVTEVAELLSLPKSNVSRLLRAMREAGFLESVPDSRGYRPGILMFELGNTYRRDSALVARAHAAVGRVSRDFGHTGYVSIRDGADVIGLTFHEGSRMLRVGTPVGQRLPAFAAATGRALLARLPDEEVARLHPGPLAPPSPNAPQGMDELMQRLEAVRRDGYALAIDESNPGVGSIAVAVGNAAGSEDACLCIVYPLALVDDAERDRMIAALLAEAREIHTRPGATVTARSAAAA
ncbi:IclR family transcriptional regulator [Roseomonas sp. GC11]|uniref:IclR family transcriptional regulator n=1 Tax=Roseomonas sp. GC11 TaxID=2950546 RepID=UPI00210A430D|nr:IclR family transcriptional regulator [Roseomonas sp. GC11]MCQ4159575.1 IclR family transcriptional regulator [Roseomonas sp. GC11]